MATPFTQINQQFLLAIKDGFVAVPDLAAGKRLSLSGALSAISGSSFIRTSDGRLYYQLPKFERNLLFPLKYYKILRSAAGVYAR